MRVVTGLTETSYDLSTLGLSTGTYMIQVGSLFFIHSIDDLYNSSPSH